MDLRKYADFEKSRIIYKIPGRTVAVLDEERVIKVVGDDRAHLVEREFENMKYLHNDLSFVLCPKPISYENPEKGVYVIIMNYIKGIDLRNIYENLSAQQLSQIIKEIILARENLIGLTKTTWSSKEKYNYYDKLFSSFSKNSKFSQDFFNEDKTPVAFCHNDMSMNNFIVSNNQENPKLLAIVDWELAGVNPISRGWGNCFKTIFPEVNMSLFSKDDITQPCYLADYYLIMKQ